MKYYLVAGERSGDLHAANLIRSLSKKDPGSEFRGFGGNAMQKAGMQIVAHYNELSVMGFIEVLTSLSRIYRYLKLCQKDILDNQPDVLILVDYPGFNMRMAKFAKLNNIRVFYYISPKIWAWNQGRAWKIKKYVDRMFCILPFEKSFYQKFGIEVDYIGNPIADAVNEYQPDPEVLAKNHIHNDKPKVALLPGSRRQELKYMLPVFNEIIQKCPTYHFIVAGVKDLGEPAYDEISNNKNASVIYEQTYDILSVSDAAIVTSGTATLETALWNVPQIVVYKANAITYQIAKWVIKVKYISLVNLIIDKELIKEMIQDDLQAFQVGKELKNILSNKSHRNGILEGYEEIRKLMGEQKVSDYAANLMVNYLDNSSFS